MLCGLKAVFLKGPLPITGENSANERVDEEEKKPGDGDVDDDETDYNDYVPNPTKNKRFHGSGNGDANS